MIVVRDQFQGIDAKLPHRIALRGAAATMGIETIVVVIEEDGAISIVATDDGVPVESIGETVATVGPDRGRAAWRALGQRMPHSTDPGPGGRGSASEERSSTPPRRSCCASRKSRADLAAIDASPDFRECRGRPIAHQSAHHAKCPPRTT